MTAFFVYLFEVIICSALFTGYYWWVLRNGSFYRWNRLFINASVVLSVVIPLLNISIPVSPVVLQHTYDNVVNYITVGNTYATTATIQSGMSSISWVDIGFIAYMIVTFVFLVKEFFSFIRIVRLKRKAELIHTNESDLYCTDDETAPFTFFKTIFWRKDISVNSGEGRCMLRHELAHVSLGHSWDRALMQFVCCIFPVNPFFLLLRRELELVHEFEADRESLGEGNAEELSSLILSTLYPSHYHGFTSRFYQSSIKRRIFMITKREKSKLSIIRKIGVIPVLFITLFAFSVSSEKTVASPYSNNITEDGIIVGDVTITVTGSGTNKKHSVTKDDSLRDERKLRVIQSTDIQKQSTTKGDSIIIVGYDTNKTQSVTKEDSLDKIVLRNGRTIEVNVQRSLDTSIEYIYPGETSLYERPKSAISHILYGDGRKEFFNESVTKED